MIKYEHEDGTPAPAIIVAEHEDKTVNLRVFGRTAEEGDTFVNHVKRSSLKSWQSTSSSSDDAKPALPRNAAKKAPAKKAAAS
jgi:hypothetical protein